MPRAVRLVRVKGVDVRVDWTWIACLAACALAMACAAPWLLPTFSPIELAAFATLASVGLPAALVLHEAVRVAVTRASGIPVRRVTLLSFGAITDLETASPPVDAVAAIASTIVSALAGGGAMALAAMLVGGGPDLAPAIERGGPGLAALAWFGIACFLVAALNALPVMPLGGGRVLRAITWRATGDAIAGTRGSARAGIALGFAATFGGVAIAHGGAPAAGAITAAVGWVVAFGAAESHARVVGSG